MATIARAPERLAMSRDDEKVHDALCDELARRTGDAGFTVAEFAAEGATVFRVSRDGNGTPAPKRKHLSASALVDHDSFYRRSS
jgi:hypothetical protein